MKIGKVVKRISSTKKNQKLVGTSIVLVQEVNVSPDGKMTLGDDVRAAVDPIGSGTNKYVLVTEGANARLACTDQNTPVDMAIVGILDD